MINYSKIVAKNLVHDLSGISNPHDWLWDESIHIPGLFYPIIEVERVSEVTQNASLAFWAEIAKQCPEIKSGDFPPGNTMNWDEACETAFMVWYSNNYDWKTKKPVKNLVDELIQLNAQDLEDTLFQLAMYFKDNEENIPNMDAKGIKEALIRATRLICNRTSN